MMSEQSFVQCNLHNEGGSRKVVVLIPGLTTVIGGYRAAGAARMAVRFANALAGENFLVDLVLFRSGGQLPIETSSRVRVVSLGGRSWVSLLLRLRQYMRTERPQCIFAQDIRATLLALLARRLARVSSPVIMTVHATLSKRLSRYSALKRAFIREGVRQIHLRVDAVVAVSHAAADDLASLLRLPREKVQVIYNPVVTKDIFRLAHERLHTKVDFPFILSVGRLRREKGFDVLLHAFVTVRRKRDIRLIILGDGPERQNLERLAEKLNISEYVSMPGFVENPFPYMVQASLFVLPSRWEGLPTALIEALCLGTPIVSTDCPSGPAEILEQAKWGYLVPVDDPEALASAILRTLNKSRKAVPPEAWRRFTEEESVKQYIKLMEEVCLKLDRHE